MGWKYYSVSTDTWGGKVELPAFDFTGGRTLNTGNGGRAVFRVRDAWVAEALNVVTLAPLERVLVAEFDGNAVYAGFITGIDEDIDAGTVTVDHTDIWWLWKARHVLTVRGDGDQSAAPMTWTNRTLATLANIIVRRGMDGLPTNRYELPIITNADVAGAYSRTYYGYKFESVMDALQELMDTDGGPDIDFDVQWSGYPHSLRWVMRSGALTSGLWEWDATAAKSEVSQLKLKTDALKVANRVIGAGEGTERKMLVRDDDSFTTTAPALERVVNYSSMSDGGQLQARVTSDLQTSNDPTQQISFRIPVSGSVKPGDLILGGTACVKTSGLYFLDEGWHDWRLIQWDFDRDWITMQFQMIGG